MDAFQFLGIDRRGAALETLRKAWKKACLIHHPDRNRDHPEQAHKMTVEINRAYENSLRHSQQQQTPRKRAVRGAGKFRATKANTRMVGGNDCSESYCGRDDYSQDEYSQDEYSQDDDGPDDRSQSDHGQNDHWENNYQRDDHSQSNDGENEFASSSFRRSHYDHLSDSTLQRLDAAFDLLSDLLSATDELHAQSIELVATLFAMQPGGGRGRRGEYGMRCRRAW